MTKQLALLLILLGALLIFAPSLIGGSFTLIIVWPRAFWIIVLGITLAAFLGYKKLADSR